MTIIITNVFGLSNMAMVPRDTESKITREDIENFCRYKKLEFADVIEVPADQLMYYLYTVHIISKEQEAQIKTYSGLQHEIDLTKEFLNID